MLVLRPALLPALLALLVALLLAAPAADARTNVAVGIGDSSPAMFTNKLFTPLKIKRVRYVIRWDAIQHPAILAAADAYVEAARAAGAQVLMHISTNDYRSLRAKLPSVSAYRKRVGALVRRYRPEGVTEWGVWNEANHPTEPTWRSPERAAQYFQVMRALCPGCTIVALDLLDSWRSPAYIVRFYRALRPVDRRAANVVGIHNYSETNRGTTGRTNQIIRDVRAFSPRAVFWFTETGGIVRSLKSFTCNPNRAAAAVQRAFYLAWKHRLDVRRLYIYSFFGERPSCKARDYGLVTWNGKKRPAYSIFSARASKFAR